VWWMYFLCFASGERIACVLKQVHILCYTSTYIACALRLVNTWRNLLPTAPGICITCALQLMDYRCSWYLACALLLANMVHVRWAW
jgi:hypothetical protein